MRSNIDKSGLGNRAAGRVRAAVLLALRFLAFCFAAVTLRKQGVCFADAGVFLVFGPGGQYFVSAFPDRMTPGDGRVDQHVFIVASFLFSLLCCCCCRRALPLS